MFRFNKKLKTKSIILKNFITDAKNFLNWAQPMVELLTSIEKKKSKYLHTNITISSIFIVYKKLFIKKFDCNDKIYISMKYAGSLDLKKS